MIRKKDLILSLIAGFVTALFLLLVFPNVKALAPVGNYKALFVIGLPIVCALGVWVLRALGSVTGIVLFDQLGKFGIVGVLNTAVDFGILNLLIGYSGIASGSWIAVFNIISFTAAVTNSFFWNRLWVFENRGKYGSFGEFMAFIVVSLLAIVFNTAIVYGMTTYMNPLFGLDPKAWANLAKVFATLFSMIWNFVGYKFVVFK